MIVKLGAGVKRACIAGAGAIFSRVRLRRSPAGSVSAVTPTKSIRQQFKVIDVTSRSLQRLHMVGTLSMEP
jgi:hypothetical protein